ncbi:MAG: cobalamin-dependent protein, partial [Rhodospirillales bacterium]|nr:cobalamin-dependent protein [Rhodospirillales bacterium]
LAAIESGARVGVGVNRFTESEPCPLTQAGNAIQTVDPKAEALQIARLETWRQQRDSRAVKKALADLAQAAKENRNLMESSIACAHAGVTTGEWGQTLREVFGEFRAPTGIAAAAAGPTSDSLAALRAKVDAVSKRQGRRLKMLIAKPGLDGHSNGAEQIAVRARVAGIEVVYEGIRQTPERIVAAALEEHVHLVGLSILSGSHMPLIGAVLDGLKKSGLDEVKVVAGGIIPVDDAARLQAQGVARIFTPKDYDLTAILSEIVGLLEAA